MISTHSFDTGELSLSYAEWPAAGPPLLVLHGLMGRWQDVEPFVAFLAHEWHVYAADLRGHGDSDRTPDGEGYRLSGHVHDISAFLREVPPHGEPVVLAGFSLGGMVALGTAAEVPDHVRALVLVDPPLMMRTTGGRSHPVWDVIGLAHEITRMSPPFEEIVSACREALPEADETTIMAIATNLSKMDPDVADLAELDRFLDGIDLEAAIQRIRSPILLLHGDEGHGAVVGEQDVAWMRAISPHAHLVRVPDAGHQIPLDIVERHMRAFLDEL